MLLMNLMRGKSTVDLFSNFMPRNFIKYIMKMAEYFNSNYKVQPF